MSHKTLLEALDRVLKDLMGNNLPFGGKTIILGGRFAQLPAGIRKATRAQIISASFKTSYLWSKFKIMKLKENMRIQNNGNHPKLLEFDQWLEKLGDEKLPYIEEHSSSIELPQHLCANIDEKKMDGSKENTFKNSEI